MNENAGTAENAPAVAPDPKRQTSRISLESVLGSSATESDDAPRTIKLQRPAGTGSTIKVQNLKADSTPNTPDAPPLEEEAAKPDSEKKTIKVKRPSIRTSPATGESPATADAPTLFAPPVQALVPVARVHWTFILAACATLVVSGVLVYVLLAQALGPNISLTELSYGAHGTELSWPGRIRR